MRVWGGQRRGCFVPLAKAQPRPQPPPCRLPALSPLSLPSDKRLWVLHRVTSGDWCSLGRTHPYLNTASSACWRVSCSLLFLGDLSDCSVVSPLGYLPLVVMIFSLNC